MNALHSENLDDSTNQIIKVLLVDDDESFLKIAKLYIEKTNNKIQVETTISPRTSPLQAPD